MAFNDPRTACLAIRHAAHSTALCAWLLLLIVALFLPSASRAASEAPALESTTQYVLLQPGLVRWLEPSATADLPQAQQQFAAKQFTPVLSASAVGYTSAALWFHTTLTRTPQAAGQWVLTVGPPQLDDVQVWAIDDQGRIQHIQMGDHVTGSKRPLQSRHQALNLDFGDSQTLSLWVRVRSISTMNSKVELWSPQAFWEQEAKGNLEFGAFLGVLVLVTFFYLLVGTWLKDLVMLSYAGLVGALFLLYFGTSGTSQLIFPGGTSWQNDAITGVGNLCSFLFSTTMWGLALNIHKRFKALSYFYWGNIILESATLPWVTSAAYSTISVVVYFNGILLGFFLAILAWFIWWRQKNSLNFIHLTALSVLLIGGTINTGILVGLVPKTPITETIFAIATLMHVLVMNFGMAMRIYAMQRDKLAAEQTAKLADTRFADERRFLGVLTHEFRTPLASIDRSIILLQSVRDLSVQEVEIRLHSARTQTRRLNSLVDSFLFGGNPAGKAIPSQLKTMEIHKFLSDLANELDFTTAKAVQVQVAPPDLTAQINPRLLTLVIHNLLDNALRYSPSDSKVMVEAYIDAHNSEAPHLCITVSDQGAGLSADELACLGQPYFQTTTAVGKQGTGLGYHFCMNIVQAMQGELKPSNRPEGGLCVAVRLPQV